jgi:hypothetical protein
MSFSIPDMITLISSDGFEFTIDKSWVMVSTTLRSMLSGPGQFTESLSNQVTFRAIPGKILEKICIYFHYKHCYGKEGNIVPIPDFVIEPELALDLLMAAHFLDC